MLTMYLKDSCEFVTKEQAEKLMQQQGTKRAPSFMQDIERVSGVNFNLSIYSTWYALAFDKGSEFMQLAEAVYGELAPMSIFEERRDFGLCDDKCRRVGMAAFVEYRNGRFECRVHALRDGKTFGAMRAPFYRYSLGAAIPELRSRVSEGKRRASKNPKFTKVD